MDKKKQSYDEDKDYTLRSRIIVFEEEIKHLRKLMYGEHTLIWTYMTDSQGRYSEEKTVKLVNQIVDEERYRRMHVWDYDVQADKLPFYKNILYCVLRTYTSNYVECGGGNRFGYGEPEEVSFSDILSAFGEHGQDLLDGNIVFFMEILYEIFSKKKICLDVLNRERADEAMQEKIEEEEAEIEIEFYEHMEDILARESGYDINEMRDEEQRIFEEIELQAVVEKEKLIKSFAEKEHFCQSLEGIVFYLKKNTVSAGQLFAEMKELVSGFLFDQGAPVFLDEEAYVEVMVQLKKTIRMAQRYAEDME